MPRRLTQLPTRGRVPDGWALLLGNAEFPERRSREGLVCHAGEGMAKLKNGTTVMINRDTLSEVSMLISSYSVAKKQEADLIRWRARAWAVGATYDDASVSLELQCAEMIGWLRDFYKEHK